MGGARSGKISRAGAMEKMGVEELLQFGQQVTACAPAGESSEAAKLAREWLRIRDRNGQESPLLANAAQQRFEARRGDRNIVVKARQMGITTWIAGRFFLKTITGRGVLTLQVAHTREAAESIFRMVQRFWECMPEEMRKGPLKRSRANVGQMVFPELDSEFRVLSAADSNAGRGLTAQNLHLSEVSRWPGDAAATLAGLRASLVPGGELVLESTPNGAHGCFYEEWKQADEKGTVKHFFPWWIEPAYVAAPVTDLREDELELMRKENLSAAQIGFRRSLEASYRGLRAQEFAEDAELCFRATGQCAFEIETLEKRLKEAREPQEQARGAALRIWLPPQPERSYILAADPAGGGPDGDYAAVEVIDETTGAQCAELEQRLNPSQLADVIAKLAADYRQPMIVVERNNHGETVLAYLETACPLARLFHDDDGKRGWLTTGVSKARAVAVMDKMLARDEGIFASERLLQQCRTFITRANGSFGAAGGAHDDLVMAMAIAQAVRKKG